MPDKEASIRRGVIFPLEPQNVKGSVGIQNEVLHCVDQGDIGSSRG